MYTSLPIGYSSVILMYITDKTICVAVKWFNFPSIIEQCECFHHPKPGDLLISAVVLSQYIHHKNVGREVYQH